MKLDAMCYVSDLREVPALARAAETCGFDALWTAETAHDPFFPILLAAEHTRRIQLGTAIALAFPRSPMIMAHVAWDLARYTNGRFILGLGTQVRAHNEKRFSVAYDPPGPRFRDTILAMRAIWDCWQNGTKLRYEGEYYRHTLMTPFFNPGPIDHPDIPIYGAGVNPYVLRMVGELCQGFHVHPLHSIGFLKDVVVPGIAEGAAKAGRSVRDVEFVSFVFTIIGDTEEEQRDAAYPVRQQIAFYASTPAYRGILDYHGWGDAGAQLHAMSKQGRWGDMADVITDDMLEALAVRGTTADIAQKVVERYDGILDRALLYYPYIPGTNDDRWRAYADTLHAAIA